MSYALMTSGGKDSTLALDRARRRGLDVGLLVNIYDGRTGRVRFHGVPQDLIAAQARAIGAELVAQATTPEGFEAAFRATLGELAEQGLRGVVFGNIHLEDVRAWYEERVRAAGLEHVEPLWGEPPELLGREVIARGFRALVVSADEDLGAAELVGREFDEEALAFLLRRPALDPCGERGEYHTFVYDGPLFRWPVAFRRGERLVIENHRFVDLRLDGPENPTARSSGGRAPS